MLQRGGRRRQVLVPVDGVGDLEAVGRRRRARALQLGAVAGVEGVHVRFDVAHEHQLSPGGEDRRPVLHWLHRRRSSLPSQTAHRHEVAELLGAVGMDDEAAVARAEPAAAQLGRGRLAEN